MNDTSPRCIGCGRTIKSHKRWNKRVVRRRESHIPYVKSGNRIKKKLKNLRKPIVDEYKEYIEDDDPYLIDVYDDFFWEDDCSEYWYDWLYGVDDD